MAEEEYTFRGTVPCAVDQKRRLTVPARFAKALTPRAKRTLVAVRGQGKCLDVYALDHWQIMEEKIRTTSFSDPATRKGIRRWMATMEEMVMDNQGRVTLSTLQMEDVGIDVKSQVVVYGALDHLEIYSLENWKDFLDDRNIISIEETHDRLEDVKMLANQEVARLRNGSTPPDEET